jgi:flagellar biosynthesis protein FliP
MNPINFNTIENIINNSLSESSPIELVLITITLSLSIFIMFPKFTYVYTALSLFPILANYIKIYYTTILKQSFESHLHHVIIIIIMFSVIMKCILKWFAND